jgi:hypothetical protein
MHSDRAAALCGEKMNQAEAAGDRPAACKYLKWALILKMLHRELDPELAMLLYACGIKEPTMLVDIPALRALAAPLLEDSVQDLPLTVIHAVNPDSLQGWVPVIVDSHYDHIVNRMPDGTAYFEPEMADYIVAAANAMPDVLNELAAARARIAELEADAAGAITRLMRDTGRPYSECAELVAQRQAELAAHPPPDFRKLRGIYKHERESPKERK